MPATHPTPEQALAARVLDALPQTQCTRCGYADCAAYAQAIAYENAPINRCPPAGQAGVQRLADLTGQSVVSLDPQCGSEGPRTVAWIDEDWCIGCTLCVKACPTDAIIGTHKSMHTVIEAYCTGCDLCIPVCPVDCIRVENVSGNTTGWAAWSAVQANLARQRYAQHQERILRDEADPAQEPRDTAQTTLADLSNHSQHTAAPVLDKKSAIIAAALERARMRRVADHGSSA